METRIKEKRIGGKDKRRQRQNSTKASPSYSSLTAWSEKEDEKLREAFPFSTDKEMENAFNRSITSIKGRAYRLGIKKHWSMVQSVHKKNAKMRWKEIKEEHEKNSAKNVSIRAGKRAIASEH